MKRVCDTVMINGKPVEIEIDWPDGENIPNLQELAEKAYRSVNREVTIGKVTVRVRLAHG